MRGVIVDLDGTVYRGGELLSGTKAGIEKLREAGLDILFFSNNPLKNGEAYVERLDSMGLDVDGWQACSAGGVTTEYLVENHTEERILCIGHDELREQFETAGLQLTDNPAEAEVLVVSWTPEFDFSDMQDALDATDETVTFLGTDPDRTFPLEENSIVPGSGAIIGAVASVIGRDPEKILGKPSEVALEAALGRLQHDPSECLIVGDRLDTDLRMGDRAGMTTVLVLTGVTSREDIAEANIEPDYVIEHLGEIGTVLGTTK